MNKSHRVAILVFPDANDLDIAGPAQVFTEANHQQQSASADHLSYKVSIISAHGGMLQTSAGIAIQTQPLKDIKNKRIDTILLAGGGGARSIEVENSILGWIRTKSDQGVRIGSVCTGAFVVAASGVLNDRRAVTHWQYVTELQQRFPGVRVERDPIFIEDNNVWSSAGVTAGIDMTLGMVQVDCGQRVALKVAQALVVFVKRPGGQNQFSTLLEAQFQDQEGRFEQLHHWIAAHLSQIITVEILAEKMNMSLRNFSRTYIKSLGTSPAKAVEKMRIEDAKQKLETTDQTLSQISISCGFGSDERMRRTFLRNLSITPQQYRKQFKLTSQSNR